MKTEVTDTATGLLGLPWWCCGWDSGLSLRGPFTVLSGYYKEGIRDEKQRY